jgi:hypothetical protein
MAVVGLASLNLVWLGGSLVGVRLVHHPPLITTTTTTTSTSSTSTHHHLHPPPTTTNRRHHHHPPTTTNRHQCRRSVPTTITTTTRCVLQALFEVPAPDDTKVPGTVAIVQQIGYSLKDKLVLRAASVGVFSRKA